MLAIRSNQIQWPVRPMSCSRLHCKASVGMKKATINRVDRKVTPMRETMRLSPSTKSTTNQYSRLLERPLKVAYCLKKSLTASKNPGAACCTFPAYDCGFAFCVSMVKTIYR